MTHKTVSLPPLCDIVIPVHNAAHWLEWCLDEVARFDCDSVGQVIIVDDASLPWQSDFIVQLSGLHRKFIYAKNEGDLHGFGAACNFGALKSSAQYLLFLNSDCLLTRGCVDALLDVFLNDDRVALACPFSNNSPPLTVPMLAGQSYQMMNHLVRQFDALSRGADEDFIIDACTVVGNCLMVRKEFFNKVRGFNSQWGRGYGEESDMHMKAVSLGLRGVVAMNSYVYHFGSGTFRYLEEEAALKKKNHALFLSKWGKEYRSLARISKKKNPVGIIQKNIRIALNSESPQELDVLFYLPVLNQTIGGVHVVVDICNQLIREGLKACCVVVGDLRRSGVDAFQEPLLFEFLHFPTERYFLVDDKVLPKVVVSTIFSSAEVVNKYAHCRGARHLQFIQGYEAYFDSGLRYCDFYDALKYGERIITTSRWLEEMIRRHLRQGATVTRLNLGVNQYIFSPGERQETIGLRDGCFSVGAVLRSSSDKGQAIILEVLNRLVLEKTEPKIILFYSPNYRIPSWWPAERIKLIKLPADRETIAAHMRGMDIFIDASLHEGFGLMPLEALACGCKIVCSDSGGVRDYVENAKNGYIVQEITDPDAYIRRVYDCLSLPKTHLDRRFYRNEALAGYATVIKEEIAITLASGKGGNKAELTDIPRLSLADRIYGNFLGIYIKILPWVPPRIHHGLRSIFGGR